MNPRAGRRNRDSSDAALTGGARSKVLALTRKFVASADVKDQALALYVNAQVGRRLITVLGELPPARASDCRIF